MHTHNDREHKLVVGDHAKEYGGGAGMVQEAACRWIDVKDLNLAAVTHRHEKLIFGRTHSHCRISGRPTQTKSGQHAKDRT